MQVISAARTNHIQRLPHQIEPRDAARLAREGVHLPHGHAAGAHLALIKTLGARDGQARIAKGAFELLCLGTRKLPHTCFRWNAHLRQEELCRFGREESLQHCLQVRWVILGEAPLKLIPKSCTEIQAQAELLPQPPCHDV